MKLIYKKETELIPERKKLSEFKNTWGTWNHLGTWITTTGETFNMDAWIVATQQYQELSARLNARYVHRHLVADQMTIGWIADYPPNPQVE